MKLGDIVRAYRYESQKTLTAFADQCGISLTQMHYIEKGKDSRGNTFHVTLTTLNNIAEGMGICTTALVALIESNNTALLSSFKEILTRCEQIKAYKDYLLSQDVVIRATDK